MSGKEGTATVYHTRYPRHKTFDFSGAFDRLYADDGPYWAARAHGALTLLAASGMPDPVYVALAEVMDAAGERMTWRQLFYVRRLALLTWRIDPSADLLVETGLAA